ncbi:MAG: M28 family peptidase [Gemmatimonadota bacterium]|nr:MAG: M28 family peptidase [Gemmatimonadota bacterium]
MRSGFRAFFVAALACSAGAQVEREFDGAKALEYVETQLAFGPRVPNTRGHQSTGDWILERIEATADSVEVQAWDHVTSQGDTLHLRNFIAQFRPAVSERILYVAHWDTRPAADRSANLGEQQSPVPGANDGASGVAVLLGVADALAVKPPSFGVDLLFVDGEDYGDFGRNIDVLLGSRYYAANLDPEKPKPLFAVVWDMIGDRDLRIPQEPNSVRGAPEVVQRVWDKAAELGYGRIFRRESGPPMTDDHLPLQRAGIRAIDVIDFEFGPGNSYWHTTEDTIDKVSVESLQTVGDVAVALVR